MTAPLTQHTTCFGVHLLYGNGKLKIRGLPEPLSVEKRILLGFDLFNTVPA